MARASNFALMSLLLAGFATAQTRDVIIDTDPGVDDAFALLLALHSPELKIHAITVVAGNVTLPVGLKNACGWLRCRTGRTFPSPPARRSRSNGNCSPL
jgi:hypothetical protein